MAKKRMYVAGRVVELTRLGDVIFPEDGITRGEVVDYYRRIASVMLPHLQDRPLVLEIFPEGLEHPALWQRGISGDFPDWISRVSIRQGLETIVQCMCNEPAALVWLADYGCITFHPWLSRIDLPTQPDRMIFGLDPPEGRFDLLISVAMELRDFLKQFDLKSYAMTSGGSGLYLVVPLDRNESFDEIDEFSRDVAQVVADENPDRITLELRKDLRNEKVYIDTTRNAWNQMMIAPYSVRAIDGAPVARPVFWSELEDPDFNPKIFCIRDVSHWLDPKSDPWAGMSRYVRSLHEARQGISAMMAHGVKR
jgi:bifunctional non-homologous end joining protein LigD